MRRVFTILCTLAFVATSCGGDDDGASPTETPIAPSDDLSCEVFVSAHADFDESFDGYASEEEALESWILGSPGGPPVGTWVHHEGSQWILRAEDGSTVGRSETVMINAERYASNDIDYCQD
jgi:hypothetical protein